MEYMKVSEAAVKWGISTRRVRVLCAEGRIAGVVRQGNLCMIPFYASQPSDARSTRATKQPYSKVQRGIRVCGAVGQRAEDADGI